MIEKEIKAMTEAVNALNNANPTAAILFMLIVMVIVVILIWRLAVKSIKAADESKKVFSDAFIEERTKTRAELKALAESVKQYNQIQTAALEGTVTRLAELFTIMDEANNAMQQRMITAEAQTKDNWKQVKVLGKELGNQMTEVQDGNQEILTALKELTTEVSRLADSLQKVNWEQFAKVPESVNATMASITATVTKLNEAQSTEPDNPTIIEVKTND